MENGERCQLFPGKKEKERGKKTPLKAAHANEELARWRDLGREEGESEQVYVFLVRGGHGGRGEVDQFNSCGLSPKQQHYIFFIFNSIFFLLLTQLVSVS